MYTPACSFALPSKTSADEAAYEKQVLSCMTGLQLDTTVVGYYMTSYLGAFCTRDTLTRLFEAQQKSPNRCVPQRCMRLRALCSCTHCLRTHARVFVCLALVCARAASA